jgi:diacylglycerol kinase (ATP)
MRQRFLLVRNSLAGRRKSEITDQVVRELRRRGREVVDVDDVSSDILSDVDALEDFDAVIAAGGDGTIRTLLATEAGQAVPIGIIPAGTGNVLAKEIGLRFSPFVIADVLIAGPECQARGGTINGSPFLCMAGVGFDGRVVHGLNHHLKQWVGKFAYLPAGLGALLGRQSEFDVTLNGESHKACWMIAARSRFYAGKFLLAPNAKLSHPKFTVLLFQSTSRWVRLMQMLAIAFGAAGGAPRTLVREAGRVSVSGNRSIAVQADGDAICHGPVEIETWTGVRLIAPRRVNA